MSISSSDIDPVGLVAVTFAPSRPTTSGGDPATCYRVEMASRSWSTFPSGRRSRSAGSLQPGGAACMLLASADSTTASSSVGLIWTSSVPASASGAWPGDM